MPLLRKSSLLRCTRLCEAVAVLFLLAPNAGGLQLPNNALKETQQHGRSAGILPHPPAASDPVLMNTSPGPPGPRSQSTRGAPLSAARSGPNANAAAERNSGNGFRDRRADLNTSYETEACSMCECIKAHGEYYSLHLALNMPLYGTVVNCTSRNLTLVPTTYPTDTVYVILRYNYITMLNASSFVGLPNLIALDLSLINSALERPLVLGPYTFSTVPQLIVLHLYNNSIESLHEDALRGLSKVTFLDLSNNKLRSLPETIFNNLTSARALALSGNILTSLPSGVFRKTLGISMLFLSSNRLTVLPAGLISFLPYLRSVWLQDNNISRIEPNMASPVLRGLTLTNNPSTCMYRIDRAFKAALLCSCAPGFTGTSSCLPYDEVAPYSIPPYIISDVTSSISFPEPVTLSCVQSDGIPFPGISQLVSYSPAVLANWTKTSVRAFEFPMHISFLMCTATTPTMTTPWPITTIRNIFQTNPLNSSVVITHTIIHSPGTSFSSPLPSLALASAVRVVNVEIIYYLQPPLAIPGLSFDSKTGIISGASTVPVSTTSYALKLRSFGFEAGVPVHNITITITSCIADETCNGNGYCASEDSYPRNESTSPCTCNPEYTGRFCETSLQSTTAPGSSALAMTVQLSSVLSVAAVATIIIAFLVYNIKHRRGSISKPSEWALVLAKINARSPDALAIPREIPRSAVKVLDDGGTLGTGSFGKVTKATLRETLLLPHFLVAAKPLREDERSQMMQEAAVMAQFEHTNIIKLIGVVTESAPLLVLIEYAEHGNLLEFLKTHELTNAQRMQAIAECCAGLAHMHHKGFIHRDVAARNVLLSSDYTCKISDFGLARECSRGAEEDPMQYYTTTGKGQISVRWSSPETFKEGKFGKFSDVWSMGVLAYEVWTYGELPYKGMTNQMVIVKVLDGFRLARPEHCPPKAFKLILSCWKEDYHARPTFADLVCQFQDKSLLESNGGKELRQLPSELLLRRPSETESDATEHTTPCEDYTTMAAMARLAALHGPDPVRHSEASSQDYRYSTIPSPARRSQATPDDPPSLEGDAEDPSHIVVPSAYVSLQALQMQYGGLRQHTLLNAAKQGPPKRRNRRSMSVGHDDGTRCEAVEPARLVRTLDRQPRSAEPSQRSPHPYLNLSADALLDQNVDALQKTAPSAPGPVCRRDSQVSLHSSLSGSQLRASYRPKERRSLQFPPRAMFTRGPCAGAYQVQPQDATIEMPRESGSALSGHPIHVLEYDDAREEQPRLSAPTSCDSSARGANIQKAHDLRPNAISDDAYSFEATLPDNHVFAKKRQCAHQQQAQGGQLRTMVPESPPFSLHVRPTSEDGDVRVPLYEFATYCDHVRIVQQLDIDVGASETDDGCAPPAFM